MNAKGEKTMTEAELKKATRLNLNECDLTEIPRGLSKMPWVKELFISNNPELRSLEGIENLTQLEILVFNGTGVVDLEPTRYLKNLYEINFLESKIKELNVGENWVNLKYFAANNSDLESIDGLQHCVALNKVWLNETKVRDLSPLSKLKNLEYLNARGTPLERAPVFQHVAGLKVMDFGNSQIKSLAPFLNWIEYDEEFMVKSSIAYSWGYGLGLEGCPLEDPPLEVALQGREAILEYFRQKEDGTKTINEGKLCIVGEPGAGKTSLMRKLQDPSTDILEIDESTLGFNIEQWDFEDSDFRTNIWDFGGQEIQYMTHHYFLTPGALFVLVGNDREQNTRFDYWFQTIQKLAQDEQHKRPKVLVVLNQFANRSGSNFNNRNFARDYPDLDIEPLTVNLCENDSRFQYLYRRIKELMLALPSGKQERPQSWFPIRRKLEDLRESGKEHIDFDTYVKTCRKHGIRRKIGQKMFSQTMHRLGVMVHYWDDMDLKDFVILNPLWAVKALYLVLQDGKVEKSHGVFNEKDLLEYWTGYSPREQSRLKQLMFKNKFEVCYQSPREPGKYIAPQLLPNSGPDFQLKDPKPLKLRVRYNFLPFGILARLIVRLHEKIKYGEEGALVWKMGVVVERRKNVALVTTIDEKEGLKGIDIAVGGPKRRRKDLLEIIRDEIEYVNKHPFKGLKVEELIPCPCPECIKRSAPEYYKLDNLLRHKAKRIGAVPCPRSLEPINLSELLEGFKDALNLDLRLELGLGMREGELQGKEEKRSPQFLQSLAKAREHIKQGLIQEAFDTLYEAVETHDEIEDLDDLDILSGKWRRTERSKQKGTIDERTYQLIESQTLEALQALINDWQKN